MAYIYTISHPLADNVVYVGCTDNIEKRKTSYFRQKKIFRPIDNYILELRNQHLYPKIDVIFECKKEDSFEEEMFWIRTMKTWGFDLLNVFKLNPPKTNLYITNKSSYTGIPKERTSMRWDRSVFFEGNIIHLGTYNKKNFTVTFKAYCRKYNISYFLKYSEDNLSVTILSEKPKRKEYIKKGFWAKGSDRKPIIKDKENHITKPLRTPGGVLIIQGYKDKNSLATFISYHLKDISRKRMSYDLLDNGDFKITRIY